MVTTTARGHERRAVPRPASSVASSVIIQVSSDLRIIMRISSGSRQEGAGVPFAAKGDACVHLCFGGAGCSQVGTIRLIHPPLAYTAARPSAVSAIIMRISSGSRQEGAGVPFAAKGDACVHLCFGGAGCARVGTIRFISSDSSILPTPSIRRWRIPPRAHRPSRPPAASAALCHPPSASFSRRRPHRRSHPSAAVRRHPSPSFRRPSSSRHQAVIHGSTQQPASRRQPAAASAASRRRPAAASAASRSQPQPSIAIQPPSTQPPPSSRRPSSRVQRSQPQPAAAARSQPPPSCCRQPAAASQP